MYRISVTKRRDYSFVNAPGVYTVGYFGPCEKRDINLFSEEVLSKFNNTENYIDFNMLAADTSRRKQFVDLIKKYNIGNNTTYASFRNDRSVVVIFCRSRRKESNPDYIIFLRPEISRLFGFQNEPVLVNSWRDLSEDTRNLILETNYIPNAKKQHTTKSGKDVVQILYTGNNPGILKWQEEIINNVPASLLVWGRFLENDVTKKPNQFASSVALKKVAFLDLPEDDKQKLFNQTIEKYYFGFVNEELFNTKLYRYTIDPDSSKYDSKIANLTIDKTINDKTGFSRARSIVSDGFNLKEWEELVFKKSIPDSIKKQSDQQIENWLNGSSDFSERINPTSYKLRYTGNNPLTIKKMGLTGLVSGVYYSKKDWYQSLAKIRYVEIVLGVKQSKNLKITKLKDPQIKADIMSEEYMDSFKNEIPLDEELMVTVGNYFRQNSARLGVNTTRQIVDRLINENADSFSINEELLKLQTLDNMFIDKLYTQTTGTTGEQVMLGSFSKSSDIEYKRTKSFNVTDPYGRSFTIIFDGAIYKDNRLVMLAEYQGSQHYHYNTIHYKNYEQFQERLYRDKLKQDFCRKNNIPLITISHLLSPLEAKQIYDNYLAKGLLNVPTDFGKDDTPDLTLQKEDPETRLNNYIDNLITSHFTPIVSSGNFNYLNEKVKEIMIDLSKLVMIMISNIQSDTMNDTSFMKSFSNRTILDEGHKRLVDSFNKMFGDIYKMDYSDNVTFTKTIMSPKTTPEVSEFAFHKSSPSFKKKRYKIRVK
jgi:hypothetical protein